MLLKGKRTAVIAAVLFLTGCINNNIDPKTVILYPGTYRVYETDSAGDSSITFFDDENLKKAKVRGNFVFFSDIFGRFELENCSVLPYKPINCKGDGMYIAGQDIECGEYRAVLDNGKDVGEVNIYNDASFHCYEDACLTETITGTETKDISLENGQCVQIYAVTLIKKDLSPY